MLCAEIGNQMMTQTQPEFLTSDLYFAAYLQVVGVPMLRTTRNNGKVTFIFDPSVCNMTELKNGWVSQTGRVPAQLYANAIKNLKSMVHMA